MQKQKNILIVGGAGFIGSYTNKYLNRSGYKTMILDNLTTGDRRSVKDGIFILGDLGDPNILNQIFSKFSIDAVMHFAASIDVGESTRNPSKYYDNNVVKTLNLLNTMLHYNIKNFIFSSSAAVFGHPVHSYTDENCPRNPINPYGQTKKMVEDILQDYHMSYGLNSSSLRYFNAAGGDPTNELLNYHLTPSNLIPKTLKSLLESHDQVTIFGTDYATPDGTCIRDYVHIHDLATGHELALQELFLHGGCTHYNLGNGTGFSVREVIASISKVTGKPITPHEGPRRLGDPPVLVANSFKAKKHLGWQPIYTNLDSIIHDAWMAIKHQPVK